MCVTSRLWKCGRSDSGWLEGFFCSTDFSRTPIADKALDLYIGAIVKKRYHQGPSIAFFGSMSCVADGDYRTGTAE